MSGPLKELVQAMMGSREGVHPSIQAFPPLDLAQIARELRLDERGREAGELEQPPTDSTAEDLAELDTTAEIEQRARKAAEDYRSQRSLYEDRIRRAILSTDQSVAIEAAGQNALTDFSVRAVDDLDQLHLFEKEVEGRELEFKKFRKRHRLDRLPMIVPPAERTARILVLIVLVLSESVVNGMFFAEGSETGLIGGVTQAFVLSLLNIGGALLYALYGLPCLVHVSRTFKVVGAAATVTYVTWVLAVNLLIAHFRDLFIEGSGQVLAADLWQRVTSAPLESLIDSQSWLLGAMGIGLSILALIDATGLDDLYPGYGRTGRNRQHAIERFTDRKARAFAELTMRRDEAIADMSSVIASIRAAEHELRLAIDGRARLHRDYCAYLDHLADCRKRLFRQYVDANTRARKTNPPSRFSEGLTPVPWLASELLSDLPDLKDDTRRQAISRMEHFIKAVNEQFREEVARYPTVPGLAKREVVDAVDA